jgi:2-keto-4-pentenoate hydratase/2-oxohepta-3-ene-1,7-dioic acid hydratase in catechol pathway
MKLVRYEVNNRKSYGIWEGDFIQEISGSIFGDFERSSVKHEFSAVRLLPPAEPTKIVCIGLNFLAHIEEVKGEIPKFPSHFIKPLTAIIGPEDSIVFPRVAQRVEYEGELALVIKDRVKDVTPEEALDHVLGYTCFNDVTERLLTRVQGQLTRAKGFDTFAPFGPCIATGLDPSRLTLRTRLNGKLMQEDPITGMIFPIPFLIHYISQCMTLLPGDLVSTGSPSGSAPLQPGDVVEVTIDGIGTLRNPVKAL